MLPSFYSKNKVGQVFTPNISLAINEGIRLNILPSDKTDTKVKLILIDPQIDFIHTNGALSVPGAIEDTVRTIEFIYKNIKLITSITVSLDSHLPFQIFYPTWWINSKGEYPAPFTEIKLKDIQNNIWQPLLQKEFSIRYIETLEKEHKKSLIIWPYHTMIGSIGHCIEPSLLEAIYYHAGAKRVQPEFLIKGNIPQTEFYSILEPEIKIQNIKEGELNTAFLDNLVKEDIIYIAGQAKSHCVLETLRSITNYFKDSPQVLNKIRLLIDCTSSVKHPEIDFESITNKELEQMSKLGIKLVKSSENIF